MKKSKSSTARVLGKNIAINQDAVKEFFNSRAKKFDPGHPVVSVCFQDSNPSLAESRDIEEKKLLLPMLKPAVTDRVLDIGCGIGRWADVLAPNVAHYHGIDLIEELIEIARERCEALGNASFQVLAAQEVTPESLDTDTSFNIILIAFVLNYLNDDMLGVALQGADQCSVPGTKLLVQGPIATEKRLTLSGIWSDELQHEYSAIYRTESEMLDAFAKYLPDYRVVVNQPLFQDHLNNRKETIQHLFYLEKG